ncbi:cytochrome P450 1 [Rhodocollybia butyracea]|uniref:Cytochrome P450 1 n=1 Tax=Rhodocollybia butyracea TaxID=206335 RepID=A0A9P5QD07_9AGAR|nr:cytochrome P450 1 [Rhodocollybia butyracea]
MAPTSPLFVTLYGIAALVALLYFRPRRQSHVNSFPPGPKSPSMPMLDAWIQYEQWGREYGELVYIREHNMLILNHAHVAIDLLEKCARLYLDRAMTQVMKLSGFNEVLSLEVNILACPLTKAINTRINGGETGGFSSKIFRQSSSHRFYPAQYNKISQYLHSLITVPEEFMQHTMLLSQGLIYSALYGLDVSSEDLLYKKAIEAIAMLGRAVLESYPALERYPWLRFTPSWFPGCGFHEIANKFRQNMADLGTIPFDIAVNNLKTGTGTSLIAELALESEGNPLDIKNIKAMGAVSLLAGADTTMSSISAFLLTMVQHPDVQLKARAEIDRVIGRGRLPKFEDRRSLPYVESVYRELMVTIFLKVVTTFGPLFGVGLNMLSFRMCDCPQYLVRAMSRDPNVYSEPNTFMPERFLDSPDGPFTSINDILAFGFGRRVCVGRYMADNTVWLAIASVLATLDLQKAKDNEGNEVDLPGEYTRTFFRHPKPYQSSITPRDQQARDLIKLATAMVD